MPGSKAERSSETDSSPEQKILPEKAESRRRRGQQKMRWLDSITDSMDMNLGTLQEMGDRKLCCNPWGHKELDMI